MEQLKNNLPIISLALLILGTVNLMIFYNHFNIDILSYLDFTEVLQIQFKLFVYAISFIILMFLYTMLNVHVINHAQPFNDKNSRFKRKIDLLDWKITKWWKRNVTLDHVIIWGFVIFAFVVLITTINAPKMFIISVYIIFVLLFFILMYYTYIIFKREFSEKDRVLDNDDNEVFIITMRENMKHARSLIFFLCLVFASSMIAKMSAYDIVAYEAPYEATVVMEKVSFSTNKNYRYVGRTKNFTFFYDMLKKQSDVYPNGDIKRMFFREGIRYEDEIDKKYYFEFSKEGVKEWVRKATMYI